VLSDFAVILERFFSRGFLPGRAEGNIADFQKLRRGEKRHVGGIVIDGIYDAALVDRDRLEPGALGFDGTGQTGGSGADYHHVRAHIGLAFGLSTGQSVGNLLARAGNLFGHQNSYLRDEADARHALRGSDVSLSKLRILARE